MADSKAKHRFLLRNPENGDHNQYWYSAATIDAILDEIEASGAASAAFVSTPSLYFSVKNLQLKGASKVLDFDKKWEKDPGFVFYDFHVPTDVPPELEHQFDYVVVDPPFITEEVWGKYAETVRFLMKPDGKIMCTTIPENANMMAGLLGVSPVAFKPSIPNLVYQYCLYLNYPPLVLSRPNPEIPEEE
mmetsp:Transcript_62729/g.104304  ORF Transcript_62729/g.104304 Transcript_62729/m.104304 type:complete len:189 (+) Transcript_62729:17-583(+)